MMYLDEAEFNIDAENKQDAYKAIQSLRGDPIAYRSGAGINSRYFAWLNNAKPREWDGLEDAMEDWRFPVETDDNGNVVGINFTGQKIGDEQQMFDAIAPFVDVSSYIQMVGENGSRWRWTFNGEDTEKEDECAT